MRPQDLVILLKIVALDQQEWGLSALSHTLHISISEISESLNRSRIAKLIDSHKKNVNRHNLMEFLEHGVKYVFPLQPGTMVRGIATAHSYPAIYDSFISEQHYVWADPKGKIIGLELEPFYPKQTLAVKNDPVLYEMIALVDMLRIGKLREIKYAVTRLKQLI